MNRRNFLSTSGGALAGGAGAYATLGASSCTTTPATVLVGLLEAADAAITVLSNTGAIPAGDGPWIAAASQFITDAVTEGLGGDPVAVKIDAILGYYQTDFQGVPIPAKANIYISAAILAVQVLVAFLNAQKAAVVVAAATNVPAGMIQIAGSLSGSEKSQLNRVSTNMKAVQAKLK